MYCDSHLPSQNLKAAILSLQLFMQKFLLHNRRGNYLLFVTNCFFSAIPIFVKGKEMELKQKIIHGNDLMLKCYGEGKPAPSYEWIFNGSVIKDS